MAEAGTVLIAVRDGVLADSLRFSLELEGYETQRCDGRSFHSAGQMPRRRRACLVLDQDVFTDVNSETRLAIPSGEPLPSILMVSQMTERVLAAARMRGITEVLEKPVLGGVMLETIRRVIGHRSPFDAVGLS